MNNKNHKYFAIKVRCYTFASEMNGNKKQTIFQYGNISNQTTPLNVHRPALLRFKNRQTQ